MNFSKTIEKLFQNYIPSPFSIAVILTLLTLICAVILTNDQDQTFYALEVLSFWEKGIWNNNLLVFAYQMILILVLGHVLVLSKPFKALISTLTQSIKSAETAVMVLSLVTMIMAFINWGLGLIFGAIFARKIGEHCQKNNIPINYPLVGAAGYVGLMIWHGGISGSAPIKVSENNHLKSIMSGISDFEVVSNLPEKIGFDLTIFSYSNLITYLILLIMIPLVFWILQKRSTPQKEPVQLISNSKDKPIQTLDSGIKHPKIDHSKAVSILFGSLILISFYCNYSNQVLALQITPNALNLFMFGLAILLHGNFQSFLEALKQAVKGSSGILIQFPLYFGIMGIMKDSGLILLISDSFIAISNETTLPIFTFLSAGLVNIFVPSGGGQWAIQGPIIVEAAMQLGVPIEKVIMALSYGDQVTNMLQPFWALPLLAITGLKAKQILPYSLIMMGIGSIIFIISLLIF